MKKVNHSNTFYNIIYKMTGILNNLNKEQKLKKIDIKVLSFIDIKGEKSINKLSN